MSIVSTELKFHRSATVSDAAANGGRMSHVQIASGVKNNYFPDVTEAERAAGVTRYRKFFVKCANDDDETLYNAFIHLSEYTPGEDYATIWEGTQTDTQGDITTPTEYGAGQLAANQSAGASSFDVTIEDASLTIFRTGDTIWIGDGTNNEYHDNVTISKSGTTVTVTLDAGDSLANSFTAASTVVASVLDYSNTDLACTVDNWVETSSSGTYDETTYPLLCDNIGSVEDTWTLTFTDASNFTVSGANAGSVGSGNISSDFAPTNSNFTKPYFTLRSAGWGGTWANGDTIVFQTHPASFPIWAKQVVPAGAASYSGDNFKVRWGGESA